jgi:pimeloyl-ACP methyl ester carboxylesterase
MPFVTVQGIRVHYEWHGTESGTPVVLIMGLGGDTTAWPFQLAALAPRHRVLVLDNRGAGRSDAPDVPYTTRGMAADLLGLLDGLGVERAHLLGLSLGGAIAQEAVLAAPERFVSLQLHATWAGPHPYFHALVNAVRLARVQFGAEGFYRALSVWLFTPECFATQPELVELVVERATHHPHPTPVHAYLRQTDAILGHDARDRLHLIRCPTLVAVGTEDLITPPVLSDELAHKIPGARLTHLPGVGHGALWEAPDAFNRICLDFLDTVRDADARGR